MGIFKFLRRKNAGQDAVEVTVPEQFLPYTLLHPWCGQEPVDAAMAYINETALQYNPPRIDVPLLPDGRVDSEQYGILLAEQEMVLLAQRQLASEWLLGALQTAETDHRYKAAALLLLSQSVFTGFLKPDEFEDLRARATERLRALGEAVEASYTSKPDIVAELSRLGADCVGATVRQDQFLDTNEIIPEWTNLSGDTNSDECAYIHLLILASKALEGPFERLVTNVACETHGAIRCAPVKKWARMRNKMTSDHGNLALPRPAHNIDTVRCHIAFQSHSELVTAFHKVEELPEFTLVRVKNSLGEDVSFEDSFGYRCILANYTFTPNASTTWGELAADPHVEGIWREYAEQQMNSEFNSLADRRTYIMRHEQMVSKALEWMGAPSVQIQPAKLVVEIQWLLQEHLDLRNQVHLWYKVHRATSSADLWNDCKSWKRK